jgi:hypothetical protein
MDIYKRLRDISAVIFHEIKFTGNVYLMDVDYDEKKKYSTGEILKINEAWLTLYDEYYEKTDDVRLRKELKNKKKRLKLLIQINTLEVIISVLKLIEENVEYVPSEIKQKTLNSLKGSLKNVSRLIKFDPNIDLKINIKNVKGFASGLKTRYQLHFKEDLKVDANDLLLFYEIKSNIEQILKKDNIPDHINMLQWIAYEKEAKRKLKHGRKHNKGK